MWPPFPDHSIPPSATHVLPQPTPRTSDGHGMTLLVGLRWKIFLTSPQGPNWPQAAFNGVAAYGGLALSFPANPVKSFLSPDGPTAKCAASDASAHADNYYSSLSSSSATQCPCSAGRVCYSPFHAFESSRGRARARKRSAPIRAPLCLQHYLSPSQRLCGPHLLLSTHNLF